MSLPRVSEIERIAVLTRLIMQYSNIKDIRGCVKQAIDLSHVIDGLRLNNVDLNSFCSDFRDFHPEHWKERFAFLRIISEHWPLILKNLGKQDVELRYESNEFESQYEIVRLENVHIVETKNLLAEIEVVSKIVCNNQSKSISVVAPNLDFARLLGLNLRSKNIQYNSYYTAPYELPIEFIREIEEHFDFFDQIERLQIFEELNEFARSFNDASKVRIYKLEEACDIDSDIIILSNMNESDWNLVEHGSFWIHPSIMSKLGVKQHSIDLEGLFYKLLNKQESDVFITRSLKNKGLDETKSHILEKLEAICEKEGKTLDKCFYQQNTYNSELNTTKHLSSIFFQIPKNIGTKSIERLFKSPEIFYMRDILNIENNSEPSYSQRIKWLFRKLMLSYFSKPDEVTGIIEETKGIDVLAYHKFQALFSYLKSMNFEEGVNDIVCSAKLKQCGITINARIDRLERSKLIAFKMNDNLAVRDILYGGECSLLAKCLVLSESSQQPIESIQIWCLSNNQDIPLNKREIAISKEIIENFKERIISRIQEIQRTEYIEFNSNKDQINSMYRHFIRD